MFRFCIIFALAFTVNAGFLQKEENSFLRHDTDNADDATDLFADESADLEGSTDKVDEVGDAEEADDEEGAEEEAEDEEEETTATKADDEEAAMEDGSDKIANEAADEDFTGGLTSQQKQDSTEEIASDAADKDFTRGLTSRQSSDIKGKTTVQTVVTAAVASAKACSACMKALWTKEVPAIRQCMQHESMYYKKEDAAHDVKKKCGAEARERVHAATTQCKSQCDTDKKSSLLSIHAEVAGEEKLEEDAIFSEIAAEAAAVAPTTKSALLQASTDFMASAQARRLMKLVQKTKSLASEDHRISKETVVARQMVDKVLGDTKVGAEVAALLAQAGNLANHAAAGERHLASIEAHQAQNLAAMAH